MEKVLELLNGKKDVIVYYDIPYEYIKKNIMDFSSRLIIITDSYYKSEKATIYIFNSSQLKTDKKLRSILLGIDLFIVLQLELETHYRYT